MALRPRRWRVLFIPALLVSLVACGASENEFAEGSEAYELTTADDGTPQVDWQARLEPGEKDVTVLTEGDGPAVAEGDRVMINLMLSNGFTHRTPVDTYSDDEAGTSVTIGELEPQTFVDLLLQVVLEEIDEGTTVGTRKAITAGAEAAFGDFGNQLGTFGVGNEDGLLIVFDVEGIALDSAEGAEQDPPAWAPEVVTRKNGTPRALDFSGLTAPGPKDDLRVATLIKGDGPEIAAGNVARVNYLGQVFGADEPFDENFTREPLEAAIGKGVEGLATGVVEGWSQGLTGVTVGSRVIIQIPPRLGYGEQGQPDAGIGGTDTMYFLVDVLGTA